MLVGVGAVGFASWVLGACGDDETDASGAAPGGGSSVGGSAAGGSAAGGSAAGGSGAEGGGSSVGGSGGAATEPACDAPLVAPSLGACALENGSLPGAFACNPVTNEGCNDNEACDVAGMTGFDCYAGNTADLCEPCDQQASAGPFCTEGTTCFRPDGSGTLPSCARYCCDDGDCGGATCVKTSAGNAWFVQAPDVGVCLD